MTDTALNLIEIESRTTELVRFIERAAVNAGFEILPDGNYYSMVTGYEPNAYVYYRWEGKSLSACFYQLKKKLHAAIMEITNAPGTHRKFSWRERPWVVAERHGDNTLVLSCRALAFVAVPEQKQLCNCGSALGDDDPDFHEVDCPVAAPPPQVMREHNKARLVEKAKANSITLSVNNRPGPNDLNEASLLELAEQIADCARVTGTKIIVSPRQAGKTEAARRAGFLIGMDMGLKNHKHAAASVFMQRQADGSLKIITEDEVRATVLSANAEFVPSQHMIDRQFNEKREAQRETGNKIARAEASAALKRVHAFDPYSRACLRCDATPERVLDGFAPTCEPTRRLDSALGAAMGVPVNDGWRDRRITASHEGAVRNGDC